MELFSNGVVHARDHVLTHAPLMQPLLRLRRSWVGAETIACNFRALTHGLGGVCTVNSSDFILQGKHAMIIRNSVITHISVGVCAVAVLLTGCATATQEQKGAGTGALIGAVAGQVLGRDSKSTAIGAGLGALGGYIWSKQMEDKKRAMEQATAGTGTVVTQTADNQLKLSIPNDISFDTGRADIKPNLRPILDQFAQGLSQQPSMEVRIVGHTDNTGSDAINNPLSVNRAQSARDYLVARGVSASRIAIDGRGSREPLADNGTAEGRARNRRIDIFLAERGQR
jgi:outer membrane protein OmpA-like peptidoglycan-associated protein